MSAETAEHRMQCMEVWGGNQAVDGGVVMAGLDAWVFSRPYEDASGGGDVYYVSSCATGRITRLLVADVSGHGARVAEIGGKLRLMMRRFVNHIDQGRFVLALNDEFTSLNETGRFATAVVATFFAPTNHLTFCSAGHPPPLRFNAKRREWSVVDQASLKSAGRAERGNGFANVPLGVAEGVAYDQGSLRLHVGDLVLFYSDALIESRDADGTMLGVDGLLAIVRSADVSNPQEFLRTVVQTAEPGGPGSDDVTALLVRPNGLAPGVPLKDRVMAPVRILRSTAASLIRGGPTGWPEMSVTAIGGALIGRLNKRWGSGWE